MANTKVLAIIFAMCIFVLQVEQSSAKPQLIGDACQKGLIELCRSEFLRSACSIEENCTQRFGPKLCEVPDDNGTTAC